MRVLIVKTSSLGDLIHTFPALTDAARRIPGITFDWVAEQSFAAIPPMHPLVDRVIPSAVRQWRQSWMKTFLQGDWKHFMQQLQSRQYDLVIDAQGLIKSALITRKARGEKHGLDKNSAREPSASLFYDRTHFVEKELHAIQRVRRLFAAALQYDLDELPLDYGLQVVADASVAENTVMFLHGTTWASKRWPLDFWRELATRFVEDGMRILLPAADDTEWEFAHAIASGSENIEVLPRMSLSELAPVIAACHAVVSVDTGLAHLAAALDRPGISLYGSTSAVKTGTLGRCQTAMQAAYSCSPCYLRECTQLQSGDNTPPCTRSISIDSIRDELDRLLKAAA